MPARESDTRSTQAIQLRHLRYFLAVMEELHFGRAAERLHMAQPPLSQAIRKLEEELGVQLLERTSRGAVPTEAGWVFADEARAVMSSIDRAVAEARRAGGLTAPVRLGVVPYLNLATLRAFLDLVRKRDAELVVEISHALTSEQLAASVRATCISASCLPPATSLAWSASYDWWLARIEGAGYRFRAVYHAGGGDPQDLMAAVADGQGIGFATREFADAGNIGTHAVARQLDPPVSVPAKVIAWRADYPAQIAPIIDTMREAARELRSKTSV